MVYPIIIPLSHCGGKLKDDTELRYALRSLDKHFKDPFKVVIVGKHVPAWLVGAEHVYSGEGLKTALVDAAKAYPDGFFWWYDDLTMLRDSTGEEMKVTPAIKHWMAAKTGWANSLEKIHKRLVAEGRPAFDYSRPHGPYWFDKAMVDEGFQDWPGMKGKFPWESWILSKHDWPRRFGVVKQYYGRFNGEPPAHSFLLNYNDAGNTPELRVWLERRFPDASRFEKVAEALNRAAMVRFRLKGEADGPVYQGQNVVKPCRTCGKKRDATPAVKIEVHTLRFGNVWWMNECAPTLDAWCGKHGHTLRVWKPEELSSGYPCEKFGIIDMLRAFVKGSSDWMIFFDADVYLHPDVAAFPEVSGPGFYVNSDRHTKICAGWAKWCRKAMRTNRSGLGAWIYRNTGVWACDRKTAEALLEIIKPPYIQRIQEQHQLNWWLYLAAENGVNVGFLPTQWNCMPGQESKSLPPSCFHLCGGEKERKFAALKWQGFIPSNIMPTIPNGFDITSYSIIRHPWAMDILHIQMLHAATHIPMTHPPEKRIAVEVGSFQGASTSALIEAVNQGKFGELHIVEPRPTPELLSVIKKCHYPERVILHTRPMWEIDFTRIDFIFIDGCHQSGAFADALLGLSYGAEVVCLHDSNSAMNHHTWGASSVGRAFRRMPGRRHFEDKEVRPGYETHRGFLVSVADSIDLSPLTDGISLGD